ncbi:hypothetical protein [Flavicella sp.]|uniref:hypothetical protein n=1 Tax=Flavicella sp. TaxID=2957742 RepID=UPI0030199FC5
MKKVILIIIVFFCLVNTSAQKTINNYAYVVVPDQFSFQKEKDQYQLNSLTKFLFEKEGVKVFWDTEKIPNEYRLMDCAGLKLRMNKESSMFRSKVDFELMDCYNTIVFSSELGSSSEKDFKKAYQESIRNAFKSFSALNYTYTPQSTVNVPEEMAIVAVLEKELITIGSSLIYASETNLVIEFTKSNENYTGKVKSSMSIDYKEGEVICKLFKTSLPYVFKAQWKDSYGNFINTIAYFTEEEELHIDFLVPTGITVMKFKKQ